MVNRKGRVGCNHVLGEGPTRDSTFNGSGRKMTELHPNTAREKELEFMAGPTDQPPSPTDSTPVPDLIERYRVRRDAWIAQADELARLRDEVRGSAEREAME